MSRNFPIPAATGPMGLNQIRQRKRSSYSNDEDRYVDANLVSVPNSLSIPAGRPMGSSRSDSSYRNDDNSIPATLRLRMFPYLERLTIGNCDSFECFPADDSLPTFLTYLEICEFSRLKKFDVFRLRSLTNLEELVISNCPSLESLGYSSDVDDCSSDDEFLFNSSLRVLKVRSCVNLKTINGAWIRSFTSLEELVVKDCPLLESLGCSSDVDDCSSDGKFPFNSSLRVLRVWGCVNLKTINGAWLRSLTSLPELTIFECDKLEALPDPELKARDEGCSLAATDGQTQVPNHRFTSPMSSNSIIVCLVSLIWIVLGWLDYKQIQSRYPHE